MVKSTVDSQQRQDAYKAQIEQKEIQRAMCRKDKELRRNLRGAQLQQQQEKAEKMRLEKEAAYKQKQEQLLEKQKNDQEMETLRLALLKKQQNIKEVEKQEQELAVRDRLEQHRIERETRLAAQAAMLDEQDQIIALRLKQQKEEDFRRIQEQRQAIAEKAEAYKARAHLHVDVRREETEKKLERAGLVKLLVEKENEHKQKEKIQETIQTR